MKPRITCNFNSCRLHLNVKLSGNGKEQIVSGSTPVVDRIVTIATHCRPQDARCVGIPTTHSNVVAVVALWNQDFFVPIAQIPMGMDGPVFRREDTWRVCTREVFFCDLLQQCHYPKDGQSNHLITSDSPSHHDRSSFPLSSEPAQVLGKVF